MAQPPIDDNKDKLTTQQLLKAITDILARTELVVSDGMNICNALMNTLTTLNNTRMYYVKLMGQLTQQAADRDAQALNTLSKINEKATE
jgi:UDP-N-acetyl-D-mannosaminuronic acid transferase (WecB/TagA/CpsF family)